MTESTESIHTTKSASDFLLARGVQGTVNTLNFWRKTGTGPKYRKVLGRVYYAESDLLKFTKGEDR